MKKILFIVLSSFVFISCENKEPIRCILPNPTVSSNSPVISGNGIMLSAIPYGGIYEWTGPNGFYSNDPNPIITNANSAMAGEYKLKISRGICETEEVKINVEVITNTVTCTQSNDTASFSQGLGTTSFYYNIANAIANNEYQIYAGGSVADMYVTFSGTDKPIAGIYNIVNKSTSLSSYKVHVKMIRNDMFDYYAMSGDVLVYYETSGVVVVKFCDVPFSYSTNTTTNTTGSAKFTENN